MKIFSRALLVFGVSMGMSYGDLELSEKLSKIGKHLGKGGVHFSVTDTEGDLERMVGWVDRLLEVAISDDLPEGFSADGVVDDLGLYSVRGSGASVRKEGDLWHHRSFVLTDGKHEGMLSLFGKRSGEFGALKFAPKGADLVAEISLDLREIEKVLRKVAGRFGEEARQEVDDFLGGKAGELKMSVAELFLKMSVRGTLAVWLDEKETFELGPEMVYPVPHVAARVENGQVFWELIKKEVMKEEHSIVERVGDEVVVKPKEMPDGAVPWGKVEPQLRYNRKTKELIFAMSDKALKRTRDGGERFEETEDFKQATVGFPEKGSGLVYVSEELLTLLTKNMGSFVGMIEQEEVKSLVEEVLPSLDKVAQAGGYAAAFAVQEEGILSVANLPIAMKDSGGMLSLPMVLGAGYFSSAGIMYGAMLSEEISGLEDLEGLVPEEFREGGAAEDEKGADGVRIVPNGNGE